VDKKYEKEIEPLKNKLRLKYVESMSIILDIRILLETFFNLFGVKNITNLNLTSE
jgi:lipopolysaccharide/colanic/teichoic acid biosynthesis glycosyltransferase